MIKLAWELRSKVPEAGDTSSLVATRLSESLREREWA